MLPISLAVHSAAGALQQISESTPGERGRRAAVVALVLRGVESGLERAESWEFVRLRAEREVAAVESGAERALLKRVLRLADAAVEGEVSAPLAETLVEYAYRLETTRRLPEAEAVLALARSLAPESAETALHAGRVARLQGDRERALALYRAARELDGGGGSIGRLAAVGEAVVSEEAEPALSLALRQALRAGDAEAAAVALEERGRIRRARGARRAAARDLCVAAMRFEDPVDRARVAHQMADLFVASDDPRAAREALLLALAVGDSTQREHARGRLHTVSRDMDDQVGMRRWRSFQRPALVSLSARPRVPTRHSFAPRLARWRERMG
jgi:tetratricopeptide (TPR) repeat protein